MEATMQGYTDVDFEEALADREETRRRLAAGEKLRLVKNGTPFAVLVEPADVDRFHSEREPNPAVALSSPELRPTRSWTGPKRVDALSAPMPREVVEYARDPENKERLDEIVGRSLP